MKKILFVDPEDSFSSVAFRSMVKLCELLQSSFGFLPIVVLSREGEGENLLAEKKIKYVKIRSYNYNWTSLNQLKYVVKKLLNKFAVHKLVRLIYQEEIDLVHINTTATYVGALAARKAHIPCV